HYFCAIGHSSGDYIF
nr:immunoglobulin light chain junction region [Macaca mulatta]MOX71564.1 immunoglobulin light chain junction region [Macaca mulatta]MOX71709.1 immunoglobulin light chain junction region [Macaca mulatta]MOX72478.1 immunoglobulin light chain junction region [Macaca mulatta]MOX72486.1 immunoglobulin light chain junction region [Macaca mulatta]